MSIKEKLKDYLLQSQERRHNLAKLSESLKKFYQECEENETDEEFYDALWYFIQCLLQNPSRDYGTERSVLFVAKFLSLFPNILGEEETEDSEEEEILNLYNRILYEITKPENNCHSNKTVRFRICHLVQLMLSAVPREAELDEDVMDVITHAMLDRLQDKISFVRCQAAKSLNRLQQPSVKDCPVIKAYMFHMAADDCSTVRAAVLSSISLTKLTLPDVLDCTRDVAESVRKVAYQIIAQKVGFKVLKINQRLSLIKQGLLDHSEAVREIVKTELFQAWLITYKQNVLDLLKKLDVVGAYETSVMALKAMFECSSLKDIQEGFKFILNEKNVMDYDKLTPESVLYWLCLYEHMLGKGIEGNRYLEDNTPNGLVFAEYLENYFITYLAPFIEKKASNEGMLSEEEEDDKIEKEFVAEQLIKLAEKLDLTDNAGRKKMTEVLFDSLISVDITCYACLTAPLAKFLINLNIGTPALARDEVARIELITRVISAVREIPCAASSQELVELSESEVHAIKLKIAAIRVDVNETKEEIEAAVSSKNFQRASELQLSVDELTDKMNVLEEKMKPQPAPMIDCNSPLPEKSDIGTLVKCLQIFTELLSSLFSSRCSLDPHSRSRATGVHPTLLQFLETLVIPCMLNSASVVRQDAVKALGTCCLFSTQLAAQHFPLLMQVAQVDTYNVRVWAINLVNDLIRLFGVKKLMDNTHKLRKPSASSNEEEEEEKEEEFDEESVKSVVIGKFIEMLNDKNLEVREAATCLLTRVLISHQILSSLAVSRLILLFFNPVTKDDPTIVDTIYGFLDIFPYMSRNSHQCMEESFLPTLRVLFNAPSNSPYASVNIGKVAETMVILTHPTSILNAEVKDICKRDTNWLQDGSAHDNLAISISNQILTDPESAYVNTLCKILPLLHFTPAPTTNVKGMLILCENMMKDVKDRQAIKHLKKYHCEILALQEEINTSKPDVPLLEKTITNIKKTNETLLERTITDTSKPDETTSTITRENNTTENTSNSDEQLVETAITDTSEEPGESMVAPDSVTKLPDQGVENIEDQQTTDSEQTFATGSEATEDELLLNSKDTTSVEIDRGDLPSPCASPILKENTRRVTRRTRSQSKPPSPPPKTNKLPRLRARNLSRLTEK